jgi:hypothetical protein
VDDLNWLAGLEAAATPAPWRASELAEVYPSTSDAPGCASGCDGGCDDTDASPYECAQVQHASEAVADCYGLLTRALADARLIATLRTVAPELLAVVRAAESVAHGPAVQGCTDRECAECRGLRRAKIKDSAAEIDRGLLRLNDALGALRARLREARWHADRGAVRGLPRRGAASVGGAAMRRSMRERVLVAAWLAVADAADAVQRTARAAYFGAIERAAAAVEYDPIEHVGPDPWEDCS